LTFTLRQGIKFHDGSTFDAAAAKFSLERLKSINKGPATFLAGISKAEAPDPKTVVFTIEKNPRLALRALPLLMMVSPTAINANGKDDLGQKWLQQNSAGTGPYQLGEVTPQVKQVINRFDGYWRGWDGNHVARVENLVQLDQAAARLQLEKGDVDMTAFFNPDYLEAMKHNPDVQVAVKRIPAPQYMMMNTKLKPLDDVRVRQAISHAWNRQAWAEANPDAAIGEQIAPAPLEVLGEDYKPAVVYDYDLDKAKQLLAQAGYPNGGFGFTHYYLAGDDEKKRMGELLAQDLNKLGIQMDVRSFTAARMFEMVKDFGETQNPASAIGMTTIFTPARFFDGHNWLDWHFNSEAWKYGRNFMYYSNPEVDKLLAQAAAVRTDEEARPLYRQISDLVMKDAPVIMIETQVGKMAWRNNISGFYFNLQMYPTTVTFYDIAKA
jgi:peptide/nickel transport system substrate-binding protein